MKHVTSSHNETLKYLKQLATSAKHRRRSGQAILEGIHLCQAYLQQGGRPLLCVYTDTAAEDGEVNDILVACSNMSTQEVLVSEANFRALSSVENGVGVLFLITTPVAQAPASLQTSALLLEDVQDPGNMGTILRTAAAAGVEGVYLSSASASVWSPKVLRAGMGAHFALRIYEDADLAQVISNTEVQVLATSLLAAQTVYEADLSGSIAWLFGNEGAGVSEKLLALNVEQVIIPQNPQVESLNVAASVAICLFEQVRQHRH